MRKSTLHQALEVDFENLKPDAEIQSFSCDATGRYAVLGDSSGMLLVDLEYPFQRPKTFHHQSKSKVDCLRWNPHVSHQDYVASTSHSSVLIWRVDNDYRPLMACLRKHTRHVKDLVWCPDLPHILATAGLDGAIHLWDVRSHQSPCQTFSAGANKPAHLVAWNRLSPNALASAHDGEVWLWDTRRPSAPQVFGRAGGGLIQSLDWNPSSETELVTSCKDSSVSFWDTSLSSWSDGGTFSASESMSFRSEDQPQMVKFTPFGHSGLTSVGKIKGVQQQQKEGRQDVLYLWALPSSPKNRSAEGLQVVQRFEGHRSPIIAVDWRVVDGLVFQLVSLDQGGHIRLWRVDTWALRACGHASRSEGLLLEEDGAATVSSTGEGAITTLSASLASKLTLDALKSEIRPMGGLAAAAPSAPPPPRSSPNISSHAASSVWQEMIEVEDMARRGELRDVDIEMIDSMSRTMRLSLGPIILQQSNREGAGASASKELFTSQLASPSLSAVEESPSMMGSSTPTPSKASTPKPPGSAGLPAKQKQREGLKLLVTVEFPPEYPYAAMPKFSFRAVGTNREEDADNQEEEEQGGDTGDLDDVVEGREVDEDVEEGIDNGEDDEEDDGENASQADRRGGSNMAAGKEGRGRTPHHRKPSSAGLLSQIGRHMLMREVEDVARLALEAQRPCLELCIRHLDKTLAEAAAAGLLLASVDGTDGTGVMKNGSFALDGSRGVASKPTGADGETSAVPGSGLSRRIRRDQQLPCPRYCSAVFSGQGILVCLNCAVVQCPTNKKAHTNNSSDDDASPAKPTTQRPPRTYGALLQRTRGGSVGKNFLGPGETPQSDSRMGGKGTIMRGGAQARVLFGGNENGIGGFSPPQLANALSRPGKESEGSDSQEEEEDSQEESEEEEEEDDEEANEEDDWEVGSIQEQPEEEDGAVALYASYFLSPQSRLPINHPDHDYSFQFQDDSLGSLGLGLGLGLQEEISVESLTAAALAPHFNTQVVLLDFSDFLPGSSILAAAYSLGQWRGQHHLHHPRGGAFSRVPSIQGLALMKKGAGSSDLSLHSLRSPGSPRRRSPVTVRHEAATALDHSHHRSPSNAAVTVGGMRRLASEAEFRTRTLERPSMVRGQSTSGGNASFSKPMIRRHNSLFNDREKELDPHVYHTIGPGHPFAGIITGTAKSPSGATTSSALTTGTPLVGRVRKLAGAMSREASFLQAFSLLSGDDHSKESSSNQLHHHQSPSTSANLFPPPSRRLSEGRAVSPFHHPPSHTRITSNAAQRTAMLITEAREISDTCRTNAEVARQYGDDPELVKLWSILYVSATACVDALCSEAKRAAGGIVSMEKLRPWRNGPFGQALVENLLSFYERIGDVQTLATIVSVLNVKHPYSLLKQSKWADYDRYLRGYAELLYRWGALETRAEVLKRLTPPPPSSKSSGSKSEELSSSAAVEPSLGIAIRCEKCGSEDGAQESGWCYQCKAFPFLCVICQLRVKGQSMFCLSCSHGGHTPHMYEWFQANDLCATGCGCRCLIGQFVEEKRV